MIDTLLPQIQKLISEKTISAFKKNGAKTVATSIYNALPIYIRLVVKEKAFIEFCLSHQEKIFGKTTTLNQPVKKLAAKKTVKKLPAKKISK